MHTRHHASRLLTGVLLISVLLLGACSITGDDDDDASSTNAAPLEATLTGLRSAQGEASPPEATMTEETGTEEPGDGSRSPTATEPAAAEGGPNLLTLIEQVTEQVRPAVVFIAVTQASTQPGMQPGQQQGVGSGVIFDSEGHILTNNHVVEGADALQVVLSDGRRFDATVLGRAPAQDIAVIQIEGDDLPVATLADSNELNIGEWVIAIGNALGLEGGSSVTVGVISALDRTLRPSQDEPAIEGLIQTDAAINPGNSGGPLLNLDGQVVGINTAKIPQAEGIGFAVPSNTAQSIIDQILTGEPQATLGVTVTNVTPEAAVRFNLPTTTGVLVFETQLEGPAATAGIQPGDVIVGIDDQLVETVDDLRSVLDSFDPGQTVTVTVNRGGQEQQLDVVLGESIIIR